MICRLCKKEKQKASTVYYFCCFSCYRQHKNRIKNQNKRKNKLSAIELSTWFDSLLIHSFRCRFCPNEFEILDHITPMCLGGENMFSNIQPLCKTCDNKKRKIEALIFSKKESNQVGGERLKIKFQHLFESV